MCDRLQLLKAAANLLSQIEGTTTELFEVIVRNKVTNTAIHVEPQENELAVSALPEAQQHILDQFLPGQTLSTEQIVRLTGYENNTYLRANLKKLRDAGFLNKSGTDYTRASAPPGKSAENHLANANCSSGSPNE